MKQIIIKLISTIFKKYKVKMQIIMKKKYIEIRIKIIKIQNSITIVLNKTISKAISKNKIMNIKFHSKHFIKIT